jgi:hypothetical protein
MKSDFTPRLQRAWAIAAVGAGTLIYGAIEKGEANSKAKQLQNSRPQLPNSPYTADELSLSKSELANPLSADASRSLQEDNDRSLSTSIDAILKGGGSVNNVAQVFDGSQRGNQRLALMKENLRLNKINNFMNASRNAEQERQQQFQFNQFAPWADQAQANAAAKAGADQTINSGVNTLSSSIAGKVASDRNNAAMNAYLNGGSVSDPGGASGATFSSPNTTALATGGQSPQVGGDGQIAPLNLDFTNSANNNVWNIPGNS